MESAIQNLHFTKCNNLQCKTIYPLTLDDINNDYQHFCPSCKITLLNSHFVQCENCQSILNFIPALPEEETVIFYVGKCSVCSGSKKDEKHLTAHHFPESFI